MPVLNVTMPPSALRFTTCGLVQGEGNVAFPMLPLRIRLRVSMLTVEPDEIPRPSRIATSPTEFSVRLAEPEFTDDVCV